MYRHALSAFAIGLATHQAHAASPRRDLEVAVRFAAPASCGDAAAFAALLELRSEHIHAAVAAAGAADFDVRIEEQSGAFVGSVRSGDGASRNDSIRGERCQDVTAALSLSLALSLDPDARRDIAPPSAPPPLLPATPAPVLPPPPPPLPTPVTMAPPPQRAWGLVAGVEARAFTFAVPGAGAHLGLETTPPREARFGWLGRLRVAAGLPATRVDDLLLRWFSIETSLCGSFALSRSLRAGPCVAAEYATAFASLRGGRTGSGQAAWVRTPVRLRLDVALSARWSIGAEAGAYVSWVQPEFVLDRRLATTGSRVGSDVLLFGRWTFR